MAGVAASAPSAASPAPSRSPHPPTASPLPDHSTPWRGSSMNRRRRRSTTTPSPRWTSVAPASTSSPRCRAGPMTPSRVRAPTTWATASGHRRGHRPPSPPSSTGAAKPTPPARWASSPRTACRPSATDAGLRPPSRVSNRSLPARHDPSRPSLQQRRHGHRRPRRGRHHGGAAGRGAAPTGPDGGVAAVPQTQGSCVPRAKGRGVA